MRSSRRALLTALVAGTSGVAGCSGAGSDPTATAERTGSTGTETDGGGATTSGGSLPEPDERTDVIGLGTGPRTYAMTPTRLWTADGGAAALWFERTATPEAPALVRGWLRNGNEFENVFRLRRLPGIGAVHARQPPGRDHEATLHLAPTENNDLATAVPELTRPGDYWRVAESGDWMQERRRLAPGEAVELEYALVGAPEGEGRPTGTYEFRGRDRDLRVAVWDAATPGPTERSRFAGRSVPPIGGDDDGGDGGDSDGDGGDSDGDDSATGWYHEADASTPVFLRPKTERAELDAAVGFEVVNHGREPLGCGHWNLHKLVDGEWYHVGPVVHTADCRRLAPGGRTGWTLRAFNGAAVGGRDPGWGGEGLTAGRIGGGTYAVVVGYGVGGGASAALLELIGDPAAVTLVEGATVAVDGATATVTAPSWGDGDHPADDRFELRRVDAAEERLIAEQVARTSRVGGGAGLRNALAAAEPGVDRVVVRTDERAVDAAVGYDGDARRFRFRGEAFEARRTVREP